MNAEDRLRRFLRSAGPPPVTTENDWSIFVHAAHRRRHRHRVMAMVAAALVVAVAAGTWAVDRLTESTMPAGPVDPVILPDNVPRECPDAEPYEPASDLGTVAFIRDGDLYRNDLEGGEVKLVETGNEYVEPDVHWSPDGRWISFGEGLVVRAMGGGVCQPLGEVSDAVWGAGDTLVGWRRDRVFFGKPGQEPREAAIDGRVATTPLVPDHGGRLVAIAATDPDSPGRIGIWVLDLALERALLTHRLPEADPFARPQIAGWSPDGQWVFYWEIWQGSFPSESGSLTAVRRTPSPARIQVGRDLYKDDLTWCGDRLIVNAPDRRLIKSGRRLAAATAPDWKVRPLTILAGDIYSDPLCSPDGDAVASIAFAVHPGRSATPRIHILGLGHTAGSDMRMQDGEFRNPSEWSSDGEWVMVESKRLDTGRVSLRLQGLGGPTRFDTRGIQLIDLGPEADELGPRVYDWYQP